MAKLENNKLADVLPLIGGTLILGYHRGKMNARSWPRKRSRPLDEGTVLRNRWFALTNKMAKLATPGVQRAALTYSPNGPLYPRDYILKSAAGNMYDIVLEDGRVVYGVASVNETSKELDIIAQLTGMLLVRGNQLWQPLELGPPGTCLTSGYGFNVPGYFPCGPTRGGHMTTKINPNVVVTSASATQLWGGTLLRDVRVDSLIVQFDAVSGASYKCKIVTLSGFTVLSVVAESETLVAGSTAMLRLKFEMLTDELLSAGTKYGFAFSRIDSTTTTPPKAYNSLDKGNVGIPMGEDLGFARYNTVDLVATDTPANSGLTFPFTIDLVYRF